MKPKLAVLSLSRLLWLPPLVCLTTATAGAATFNYIYVEASEGNSSGGHVAVQFNDDVFHYQYHDEGLIRLVRQSAEEFDYHYRFAGNRGLHVSRADIPQSAYRRLADFFKLNFQIQKQQFALLDDFRLNRHLLESLLDPDRSGAFIRMELQGAGFFYGEDDFSRNGGIASIRPSAAHSATLEILLRTISARRGKDFLQIRRRQVLAAIDGLAPNSITAAPPALSADRSPERPYSFAERYQDLLTNLLALDAIEQTRPLKNLLIDADGAALSKSEIDALHRFKIRLLDDIMSLMESDRPDWGYALLVDCARLIALDASLEQGRLVFIETYARDGETLAEIHREEYREILQKHLSDTRANLRQARKNLASKPTFGEIDYSLLERQANRHRELHRAIYRNSPVRIEDDRLAPTAPLALQPIRVPALDEVRIEAGLKRQTAELLAYQKQLSQLYPYHLIERNCVTELFASLDQASNRTDDTGAIAVSPMHFIPLLSSRAIADRYRIDRQYDLPSFRQLQLSEMYADENDAWVYLRESNTLSATAYRDNPDDSFFLFFTGDEIALRPLFGAVNTLAGFGQSLLGLFSWPQDDGARLESGLRGIVMSVPELAFVNLRKGSYKFLPFSVVDGSGSRLSDTD